MENHFVDVEFKSLKKAFKFVSDNEFIFDLMDAPFDYNIILKSNKKNVCLVRCFIRPEDIINIRNSSYY